MAYEGTIRPPCILPPCGPISPKPAPRLPNRFSGKNAPNVVIPVFKGFPFRALILFLWLLLLSFSVLPQEKVTLRRPLTLPDRVAVPSDVAEPAFSDSPAGSRGDTTFAVPGNYTWTCPPGVTCIQVEVWGGGGRGGTITNNTGLNEAGGGGGGGYSRSVLAVTPLSGYNVRVGAGSTSASDGEISFFINQNTLMAWGGKSVPDNSGLGANGAAAGFGQVLYTGGNGATRSAGYAGGGGSSAGTDAGGNHATGWAGAPAPAGGGNGGDGRVGTSGNGFGGFQPGGGGGGAIFITGGPFMGGSGGNGQVVITYYYLAVYNITPEEGSFCQGDTVAIGLSGSETGVSYQLLLDSNPVGSPVAGTGNAISFGNHSALGVYTVVANLVTGGCTLEMNGSVVIHALPVCAVTGPAGPVCPGSANEFLAQEGMLHYAWTVTGNGAITGPDTSISVTVTAGFNCDSAFSLYLVVTDSNDCSSGCSKVVMVEDTVSPEVSCPESLTATGPSA